MARPTKNSGAGAASQKPLLIIKVRAKPRSTVSSLEQGGDGTWIARLRSSPVDGKANAELVGLIAERFGCARAAVTISVGAAARLKLVKIAGVSTAEDGSAN